MIKERGLIKAQKSMKDFFLIIHHLALIITTGKDGNTIRGCTLEINSMIPEAIVFTACNSGKFQHNK
jgi:hypothetical protein